MAVYYKEKDIHKMPEGNVFAQEILVGLLRESFGTDSLTAFKEEMVYTSPRIFVLANHLGLIKDKEILERYKDSTYPLEELTFYNDDDSLPKIMDMRDILDLLHYCDGDLDPTSERRAKMPTAEQVAKAMLRKYVPEGQEFHEGKIRLSSSLAVAAEYLNLIKDPVNVQYAESRGGVISSLMTFSATLSFREVLQLLCYWHKQPYRH